MFLIRIKKTMHHVDHVTLNRGSPAPSMPSAACNVTTTPSQEEERAKVTAVVTPGFPGLRAQRHPVKVLQMVHFLPHFSDKLLSQGF